VAATTAATAATAAATGRAVVTDGLGALEQLGRRTMSALEAHDPGLKRTRALLHRDAAASLAGGLGGQRQNLSAELREAAEKAAQQDDLDLVVGSTKVGRLPFCLTNVCQVVSSMFRK
jgi:hypothetical protein